MDCFFRLAMAFATIMARAVSGKLKGDEEKEGARRLPQGNHKAFVLGGSRSVGDAARICGVTPTTVCKWVARGKNVGAEKRGRTWRFDLAEIKRLRDSKDLTWLNGQDR